MTLPQHVFAKASLPSAFFTLAVFWSVPVFALPALELESHIARFDELSSWTCEDRQIPSRYRLVAQNYWGIDAYRERRIQEIEQARRERAQKRQIDREQRQAQRRSAREAVLARERQYREELRQRHPDLARHRQRYARELERRRQAAEQRRLERWQQDDSNPDVR